jgi:hypothetical protein
MNLKLNKEIEIPLPTSFANLMEEDSTITSKLPFSTSNIKFFFLGVSDFWGKKYEKKIKS